jgi:hypothetical protein
MADAAAKRQQETTSDALKSITDVAKAYAENQPQSQSPNVVVVPGSGTTGPQVINTSGGMGPSVVGGEVQVCPKCHAKMPVGTKFCTNCGYRFFE